jgi:hypothetical protein
MELETEAETALSEDSDNGKIEQGQFDIPR